ncbi:MAG TPA: ATP-binding cassette domain-containing protein [Candidatus Thermoplasmatota archaeon]|nr:ATP-binding cassette domain-containing protein [Candidatus Thermoplasmatota archaeon]
MSARPPAPHPAPALQATNIVKAFAGRTVLSGVSVGVGRGEVHAVLGPSGAGKTTLLRILNLLDAADGGEVALDGEPVGIARAHAPLNAAQHRARLRMALVPQKPVAFRLTVFENVAFGLRVRGIEGDEVAARVDAALSRHGIRALADAPARRLSGGETQRLAFARATVLPLEYLLLDEFTANLDPANVKALEQAARSAAHDEGLGVLLVTHDLFQARRLADRVTLLVDGRVVESASKGEFFEAPKDPRTRAFVAGELAP